MPPGSRRRCWTAMTVHLKASALWYAAHGWFVLPLHSMRDSVCTCGKSGCSSPAKHPHTKNGVKDASADPSVIGRWWKQWPGANVGVCTGARSGIVVLDIDPRHGGDTSLTAFTQENGELPETVEALTGGGGRHLAFQHPGGVIRNPANVQPGLDVRGDGAYVVVPPSMHASGQRYRWRAGHGPHEINPAEIPPALLELMTGVRTRQTTPDKPIPAATEAIAELVRAGQRYVAGCATASEGGRNNAAFSIAGHLVSFATDDGLRLNQSQVLNLLRPWNDRNDPPISERELAQVVASAIKNGAPRSPHVVRTRTPGDPDRTTRGVFASTSLPTSPADWPDPQPLPEELPPVAPFEFSLLPDSLRPWIEDIAERIQCPPDYPAVAAMIALAGVLGRKVGIRPKARTTGSSSRTSGGRRLGRRAS